jgi:hypothetical protein
MTLEIKELYKLNINIVNLTILISCLGVVTTIVISAMYGSILLTSSFSSSSSSEEVTSTIDLGSVSGSVISSDDLPVEGASVHVYKHMGLVNSADKNAGYSTSIPTNPDGTYSFDSLPSDVYKFTVTYPDGFVQTINNYAVWPSTSSSYVFKE